MLVGGHVLEQGEGAGAVDCELHRTDPGQHLETIEIGIEQDARIPDDRGGRIFGAGALLDPRDLAIVEIAGVKAEPRPRVHLERGNTGEQRRGNGDHDPAPRLFGDIARRHRLGLTRTIRSGQPQPGGQCAFALDDALGDGGWFRTGSR
jgi:hypothetical protein